jgi:uncharacterized protein
MTNISSHTPLRLALPLVLAAACAGETETIAVIKNFASGRPSSATGDTVTSTGSTDASSGAGGSTITGQGSTSQTSGSGGSTTIGEGGSGGVAQGTGGNGGASQGTGGGGAPSGPINVLVFNHTAGYGHQSRMTSIPFLQTAAAANNIVLDLKYAHTAVLPEGQNDSASAPDLSAFVIGGLDKYDVVFFLNTTGNVFQGADEVIHQQALQDYMEKRHGGFVGTHSATDTYDEGWQWYQDFIGSIYNGHSNIVSGSSRWKDGVSHVILSQGMVPNPWARNEEWYLFRRDVSGLPDFTVLLLSKDSMNTAERPITWVHDVPGGGRVFYSAFGHLVDAFKEQEVMRMLVTGIKWAAHRIN